MALPRDILDRVARVIDYHQSTKHTYQSVRAVAPTLDWTHRPSAYRVFDLPAVRLPSNLLDAPVSFEALMGEGLDALPDSHVCPPQDLKSLASWLWLAAGNTVEKTVGTAAEWFRSCPSGGGLYPCEIYVAAFGIQGLEPGLYHFCVRDFSLCKMREGPETLTQIKKGRPDLQFLKSAPAALLVSTIFCRSSWKYRQRGYRYALLDAGHVAQNLVTAGNGLGLRLLPRLQLNDNTMRELIGVSPDAPFAEAEAVQAMVVWADSATHPLAPTGGRPQEGLLPLVPRPALSSQCLPFGSILATHQDCVAPGMPVREIRPPLTELSPETEPGALELPPAELRFGGPSVREVLLNRRSSRNFARRPITRASFAQLNRIAFRGGSFQPIYPNGPHAGLVRPYWIVNDVSGVECGLWYYHPPTDRWHLVRSGSFRLEAEYLCLEQPLCGNAAAVCLMMADLRTLMSHAGADIYRLAHIEAGAVGQRLCLSACAEGIGCTGIGRFYDDEVRQFLALENTGWEVLYAAAVGLTDGGALPGHASRSPG